MKLLFDQNISFRIIKKIENIYHGAEQVRRLGLENSSDLEIWEYAKIHDHTIVTFDTDFGDIANLRGHPPKIIILRTRNMTTNFLADLLTEKLEQIKDFIENPEHQDLACLEIGST